MTAPRYFRKAATYTVVDHGGRKLFVDEFECTEPSGAAGARVAATMRLMLRDGDKVVLLPNGAMQCVRTREQFDVLAREAS
jgi:hypothetical protein